MFLEKKNWSKKIVNIIWPTHFGFNFLFHISDTNLKTNFFMNKIQVCKKIIKKLKIEYLHLIYTFLLFVLNPPLVSGKKRRKTARFVRN